MDGDIISRMRVEEADLLRKLTAIRGLLAAYGQDSHSPPLTVPATAVRRIENPERHSGAGIRDKVGIAGFGSYGRRVVATAISVMLMSQGPVKTREIVEFLEALELPITGENKVNAVGALLSRSADVTSHGKSGWTVADSDTAYEIVSKYAYKENASPNEFEELLDEADTARDAQDRRPQE